MGVGAAHFLVHQIACASQAEGAEILNLGGAPNQTEGLAKFKEYFGAECVVLESTESFVGGHFKYVIHWLLAATRRSAMNFRRVTRQ
jgi:lipid II:glycine glycyltransferase (peptidoglycan interpeptide bridge formation enzyme)